MVSPPAPPTFSNWVWSCLGYHTSDTGALCLNLCQLSFHRLIRTTQPAEGAARQFRVSDAWHGQQLPHNGGSTVATLFKTEDVPIIECWLPVDMILMIWKERIPASRHEGAEMAEDGDRGNKPLCGKCGCHKLHISLHSAAHQKEQSVCWTLQLENCPGAVTP